jgi:hypothetical protein
MNEYEFAATTLAGLIKAGLLGLLVLCGLALGLSRQ